MREIILNVDKDNKKTIIFSENGKLIEKYEEDNQNRIEGNIYIGKVTDVLPGMQAAFIDIGEEKNAFIHLKDILPKKDITDENNKNDELGSISKYIKQGDILEVQIKRDATSKKGPKVSKHISLPSRFIVFMPEVSFVTVSQKIEDEDEKKRLVEIVKQLLPKNAGAIIRTSAEGKTKEELESDIKSVINQYNEIKEKTKNAKRIPSLIYSGNNIIKNFLTDIIDQNIDRILINNLCIYEEVKTFLQNSNFKDVKIEYKENEDLLNLYNLKDEILKLQERKIWLKCGGFITIDKTEALVAIDVNSGKYTGKKDLEQTVFKVNKEASIEIAKQLKLRDIGGIIIIDYIDMDNDKDREEITQILKESLKQDRSKTQVIGFTKLNLLEMTRKHMFSE